MDAKVHLERLPRTVELCRGADGGAQLAFVDQRLLPGELGIVRSGSWREVVDAVRTLSVRGAPAIGVAGAAAVALWACNEGAAHAASRGCSCATEAFLEELARVAREIEGARPTAVNLSWGVRRAVACARAAAAEGSDVFACADALFDEVKAMERQDEAANRAIGAYGAALLPENAHVLTHCNAGSLATVFFGTALGVVYAAAQLGGVARVYADETRPVGQGARLTSWELSRAGVPVTLICDDMAASVMARGLVDAVVVGADRIAANGDVANKIGTYGLAVLARAHGIPFYVAAPCSSIDANAASGADIPIEQRDAAEVLARPIEGVEVMNPAFDVTPARLVSAYITERGVVAAASLL